MPSQPRPTTSGAGIAGVLAQRDDLAKRGLAQCAAARIAKELRAHREQALKLLRDDQRAVRGIDDGHAVADADLAVRPQIAQDFHVVCSPQQLLDDQAFKPYFSL